MVLKARTSYFIFSLLIAIHVIGCNAFAPPERKDTAGTIPPAYSLYTAEAGYGQRWWRSFNDAELSRLVEAGLADNFSIQQAWARLAQVRAQAVQAGADLYPDLTGTGDALYARQETSGDSRGPRTIRDYSIGLASSYELDLWGRIRAQKRAAQLEVVATRQDLNAAAVTLAAEVTVRWIDIISQRMQKRLLERQLKTNRILLELIELRFNKAMVSALDVYQQRQVVENVRAEIPLVEAQEKLAMHDLAVLLGKPPQTQIAITRTELPQPSGVPPAGLPADLLAHRPDIQAAGSRLQAADWQVAQARANRLPSLSLSARAVYGQGDLDILFDNWILSLAGNLAAPILDGGRRAAEVDRRRALSDQNLSVYRQTVLTAFKEVEDALVNEAKRSAHIDKLKLVYDAASRALEEAGLRYRNGISDYLPVLTQLLTVQRLERELIRQQAVLLGARVSLFRALGGTWPENLLKKPQG